MNGMKKTLTLVQAFALLFAWGCCPGTARPAATSASCGNDAGLYRLGGGMTANSRAVRVTGSFRGRAYACPCPAPAFAVGTECAPAPLPPPCLPSWPAKPVAMVLPAPAPGSCPPSAFDAVVCAPGGENLGQCFTLPEGEGAPEVEIYVPNGGTLEKLSIIPDSSDSRTDVPVEAGEGAEREEERVAEEDAPAATVPAESSVVSAVGDGDSALPADGDEGDMPPVFREGMTDQAAEEVLSRAKMGRAADSEGLPRIELPPEL